jgi:hypothetical protein
MKAESLIQPSWFYLAEEEKNKKHWFLYEFSLKYFDYLRESRIKIVKKWVARHSEKELAEYCAYFAKRMRNNMTRHLYRDLGGDIADDEYNRDYCHHSTKFENELLTKVAEAAWLDLLDSCSTCPTNCINDQYKFCTMFDKMESRGKPW